MATLGIDLGTGSVKAAVVEPDGTVRALASRPYAVTSPQPGWAESDPAQWLEAIHGVAGSLLAAHPDVEAVGWSGQMHGVVLADAEGMALAPAILWADARSAACAARMRADLGAAALARLGSPGVPGFAATTLRWLADERPALLEGVVTIAQPKDHVRAALGGARATDPSDASGTLLADIATSAWDEAAIAWCGARGDQLPPIESSHADAGTVRIGQRELRTVVGGADTACALAGLGLAQGDGFVAVGTGSQTVRVLSGPELDPGLRTHTFATVGAPREGWYRIGAVQNAGLALGPALAMLGASVEEATAALEHGLRADDPLFVPYLAGERTPFMDASLRGAFLDLSLATDRAAMLRSVLEGIAHAVAFGIEAVEATGASMPKTIPLVGGGTHAAAFRQLLADASGHALAVAEAPDAAVVGAAMLAMGRVRAPERASLADPVEPDAARSALLADRRARIRAWIETR